VRAIDSVRSGDEIELSQRNFYLNSIAPRRPHLTNRLPPNPRPALNGHACYAHPLFPFPSERHS
ncbi:hypothetical protein, partial [Burkholderia ubonensis]|uniref:hypothetical protein n=1 Tax=Burkholderia ubonensis TaxID=101571 RepID=UPI001E5BF5A1